jgi:glycosyltransferase involved in cell wall biosynthesis
MATKIRLHIPAIPHTITKSEYSHCAFTAKVQRFPTMMMSVGYEVYHYGVETSEVNATENITLLTKVEWDKLRVASCKEIYKLASDKEAEDRLNNKQHFVGDLSVVTTPLYKKFNERLKEALIKNYRSPQTDIICLPYQKMHDDALTGLNVLCIETGVGYSDSYRDYRIFESYAHLHYTLGKQGVEHFSNYHFVAPMYYNVLEFPLNLAPTMNKIGFFGRICDSKGLLIIVEVAKRFPGVQFILCGQGSVERYLTEPNIIFKEPVHGVKRVEFLRSLTGMMAPSLYPEPFGSSVIEAQLCGCPIITQSFGAFTETVENFKTGLLCHVLQDYCEGIVMCLEGKFDRQYVSDRAKKLYDMYNVAHQFDYIFNCILDLHNGSNGWYSTKQHIKKLKCD